MLNFFLLLLAIAIIAWTWWRNRLRRDENDREEAERTALRRRIADDPANLAAYELLGDNLRRASRLKEAAQVYTDALGRVDERVSDTRIDYQLRYKLKKIEEDLRAEAEKPSIVESVLRGHNKPREVAFCRACGASNAPDARVCETCSAIMPAVSMVVAFKLSMANRGVRKELVDGIVMIVVVVLLINIFFALPLEIRGAFTMSACIVAIVRLVWPTQR